MERDEQYSVYRTPFRVKPKKRNKNSPVQTEQANYQSTGIYQTPTAESPYANKYAKSYQSLQKPRKTLLRGQAFEYVQQAKPFRMKSAPINRAYGREPVVQAGDLLVSQFHHQIKAKAKTQREVVSCNRSRKKINIENELFYNHHYHSQRKFIIEFVEVQKYGQAHRNSMKRKLQNYDYRAVLEKPLTSANKKLPRLIISEQGVVRLERN